MKWQYMNTSPLFPPRRALFCRAIIICSAAIQEVDTNLYPKFNCRKLVQSIPNHPMHSLGNDPLNISPRLKMINSCRASCGPLPQKTLGPFIRRLISRKPSPWTKIDKNWTKAWCNEGKIVLPLTPSLLQGRRGLKGTMWVGGTPWGLSLSATRFQEERGWSGSLRPK